MLITFSADNIFILLYPFLHILVIAAVIVGTSIMIITQPLHPERHHAVRVALAQATVAARAGAPVPGGTAAAKGTGCLSAAQTCLDHENN